MTSPITEPHDEIIALLSEHCGFHINTETLHLPMQAIQKVTPELPPLLFKYLTTGTAMGRSATADKLYEILLVINNNQRSYTQPQRTREDVYRELTDAYSEHDENTVPMQMTAIWNYNNVASDLGMNRQETDEHIYDITDRLQRFTPDEEDPDTYWRGVFALKAACRGQSFPDVADHRDFIIDAGSSNDLAALIPIAQERNLLSIEGLRAIRDQQQSIATSCREGVL